MYQLVCTNHDGLGGAGSSSARVVDVRRQLALAPEGDAGAIGARVVAPLQVHRIDLLRQGTLLPEGDAGQ